MWPRVGFYAAQESDGSVVQCALPDADVRCAGWSEALGATLCGTGYLQGSYACSVCASGFFLQVISFSARPAPRHRLRVLGYTS